MASTRIGRKAGMVLFMLVLGVFMVLGIIIVVLSKQQKLVDYIGGSQVNLINAYDFGDRVFLYMDASTAIAAKSASHTVAASAGFFSTATEEEQDIYPCGAAVYPLLNDDKTLSKCKPDYSDSFRQSFTANFDSLLQKYRYSSLIDSEIAATTDISSDDLKVKVESKQPINFPIYGSLQSYYLSGQTQGLPELGTYTQNQYGYTERGGLRSASRGATQVDSVVLHYTVSSTVDSAYNTLKARGLSYHYVIDKAGTVFQFIPEDRSAQHAGCVGKAAGTCEDGWNSRSIGISFVNCGFDVSACRFQCSATNTINGKCWELYPDAQLDAAAKLIAQIALRNPKFTIDASHIRFHSEIDSGKSDPGPELNRDNLVTLAKKYYDEYKQNAN